MKRPKCQHVKTQTAGPCLAAGHAGWRPPSQVLFLLVFPPRMPGPTFPVPPPPPPVPRDTQRQGAPSSVPPFPRAPVTGPEKFAGHTCSGKRGERERVCVCARVWGMSRPYLGPWPGSCYRSHRGCRAGGRTPTPAGRCPPRTSRRCRSRSRAARTAVWRATLPSS